MMFASLAGDWAAHYSESNCQVNFLARNRKQLSLKLVPETYSVGSAHYGRRNGACRRPFPK